MNNLVTLDNLNKAKELIEKANISQLKEIISRTEALRVYAAQAKKGLEIQNQVAEIKLRAERRIGEQLKVDIQHGGQNKKAKLQGVTSLKDLGIAKIESHRWQQVASLPNKEFEEHLAQVKASNEELTTIGVIRLARELQKGAEKQKAPPLPSGKYNIIYADPPWDIGSMVLDKWESPLKNKYPTLSLDELKLLDILSLSANDSVCFLWATHTTLPDALELLKVWDFQYHCLLTWDKGNGWSMAGFHRKTELVLFGYKGVLSNVIKQKGKYIPTIFYEKKTTHSTKPEILYKIIEERTMGKKIELFGRKKRNGWDTWGNEF